MDFESKIEQLFNKLNYPTPTFTFNENTKQWVSQEEYFVDDIGYIVVVKSNGEVVYGLVDGPNFLEEGYLGYIVL